MHHARIDRRRSAHPQNILERLRGGEHARLAARRTGDLQTDGEISRVKPQGSDSAVPHETVTA